METINLAQKFSLFSERWSPKAIADVNDFQVKLVKVKGEFVWHTHDDDDELFLVVKGTLQIKLRDRDLWLREGELAVIPRGVEHMPVAAEEVEMLLLERKGVVNTGAATEDARTVTEAQPI